jgi:hypothetical protein
MIINSARFLIKTSIPLFAGMLALATSLESAGAQQNSILTYHGDASRSGSFVVPVLTWEKARSVHLDPSFDARVAGHLYAQPLYWHAPGSNTAMLLVATEDDVVQAFLRRAATFLRKAGIEIAFDRETNHMRSRSICITALPESGGDFASAPSASSAPDNKSAGSDGADDTDASNTPHSGANSTPDTTVIDL